MPDIELDDNCLFEEIRRLNVYLNSGRFIDPTYGKRGPVTELVSVALAYCFKEPKKLRRRRGGSRADPLLSPIRDDYGLERGQPRGFKGCARKLTKTFDRYFAFIFRISFYSSSETRDRDCGDSCIPRTKGVELR
ncbi:hypothetical protein TNCV_3659051 [Trichonephila clavipes]|nr:hypothetical protein TNCV_3659051 [Trichonephila clavipes]